jgi:hypothetical protein
VNICVCVGDDAFAFAKIINVASEREVIAHSFTKSFWPVQ